MCGVVAACAPPPMVTPGAGCTGGTSGVGVTRGHPAGMPHSRRLWKMRLPQPSAARSTYSSCRIMSSNDAQRGIERTTGRAQTRSRHEVLSYGHAPCHIHQQEWGSGGTNKATKTTNATKHWRLATPTPPKMRKATPPPSSTRRNGASATDGRQSGTKNGKQQQRVTAGRGRGGGRLVNRHSQHTGDSRSRRV